MYIEHAKHFITEFYPYLHRALEASRHNDDFRCNIYGIVNEYNRVCKRHVIYDSGASRAVFIDQDFVVKMNLPDAVIEHYGTCETEFSAYKWLVKRGWDYLFAPITVLHEHDLPFYVMPYVEPHYEDEELEEVLNEDEWDFVNSYFLDLHEDNWGLLNGAPVILDYAWNIIEKR